MADAPDISSGQARNDSDIRCGIELIYFGYSHMTRSIDADLAQQGLGRAHHRALYFIARQPDISVGELLALLAITKQALGRVLADLARRELVESHPGTRDKRQKLLRLTASGAELERKQFEALRTKMGAAYDKAGDEAVRGFWQVLEGLIPPQDHDMVMALRNQKD